MKAVLSRFEAIKSRILLLSKCHHGTPPPKTGSWRPSTASQTRSFRISTTKSQQAASELQTAPPAEAVAPALRYYHPDDEHPQFESHTTQISTVPANAAQRRLVHALRLQNPDKLLAAFFAGATDKALMQTIPATTFSEILKVLRPANLIEPYKAVHQDLSATPSKLFGLQPIEKTFANYFRTVRAVVHCRRRAGGTPLNLADYTLLLDCARALGDGPAAEEIWAQLVRDGIVPDTTCYNHYMGAKCWSGLFQPEMRQRTRLRSSWVGDAGTLSERYRSTHGDANIEIPRAYEEMVSQGLVGDQTTFTLLMLGLARGGDVLGMKSVLRRVWNVDADKLMELDEADLEPVAQYATDSPLYPTSELLYAIAHGFGINSDVPTALRLVDYVSRCYEIAIPIKVWEELLAWTHAMSVYRSGNRRKNPADLERLPNTSVESLWQVMTGEPYNIRPTMPMYDRYIRHLIYRQRIGQACKRIEEAYILFKSSLEKCQQAWQELELAKSIASYGVEMPVTEVSTGPLQRKLENARLAKLRDVTFVRRWMRKLLGTEALIGNHNWERRGLPAELRKWKAFMPKEVRYRTSSGDLELRRL